MSDPLRGQRPKSEEGNEGDEALLTPALKAALRRELGPRREDRERVRAGVSALLAGAPASAAVERADAEMGMRMAQLKAGGAVTGHTLAAKLIVVSVALVSAVGITATLLRRPASRAPAASPPSAAGGLEPASPAAASPASQVARAAGGLEPASPVAASPASQVARANLESPAPSRAGARSPARKLVSRRSVRAEQRASQAPLDQPAAHGDTTRPAEVATSAELPSADPSSAKVPGDAATHAAAAAIALSGELELLRAASNSLERADHEAALAVLTRYLARYPRGSLQLEAQALRSIALCQGKRPGASQMRDSFLRAHPDSALALRVRSACP